MEIKELYQEFINFKQELDRSEFKYPRLIIGEKFLPEYPDAFLDYLYPLKASLQKHFETTEIDERIKNIYEICLFLLHKRTHQFQNKKQDVILNFNLTEELTFDSLKNILGIYGVFKLKEDDLLRLESQISEYFLEIDLEKSWMIRQSFEEKPKKTRRKKFFNSQRILKLEFLVQQYNLKFIDLADGLFLFLLIKAREEITRLVSLSQNGNVSNTDLVWLKGINFHIFTVLELLSAKELESCILSGPKRKNNLKKTQFREILLNYIQEQLKKSKSTSIESQATHIAQRMMLPSEQDGLENWQKYFNNLKTCKDGNSLESDPVELVKSRIADIIRSLKSEKNLDSR